MSYLDDNAAAFAGERAAAATAMQACLDALTACDNDVSAIQISLENDSDPRAVAQYAACAILRGYLANASNAVNSYLTPPDLGTL